MILPQKCHENQKATLCYCFDVKASNTENNGAILRIILLTKITGFPDIYNCLINAGGGRVKIGKNEKKKNLLKQVLTL